MNPGNDSPLIEEVKTKFLFRRLRKNDRIELSELCGGDTKWSRYFPRHKIWVKNAIDELSRPGRAAIGAFEPYFTDAETLQTRLEGCFFLKLSDYDNSAEIKNLVISERKANHEDRLTLYRSLINKAVRYCEIRDIGRLEFEVPQPEHELISIFLRAGFRVSSVRERYSPGQEVCLLEKTIGEKYSGDPFDLTSIGMWVMLALFPSHLIGKSLVLTAIGDGPTQLLFEVSPLHPAFAPSKVVAYDKRLRASLLILEEPWNSEDVIDELIQGRRINSTPLNYVIARDALSNKSMDSLALRGVTVLQWDEVKEIVGGKESSLSTPIDVDDVGGVLTVLEYELIEVYRSYPEEFIYYLLSGLGTILHKPDSTSDPEAPDLLRLLAIYCPYWINGKKGIVAIAEIREIGRAPIDEAFDLFPETPSPITRDDLKYYRTRTEVEIPVLRCERLSVFESPLEFNSAAWDEHRDIEKYLIRELNSPVNSVYLDVSTAQMLRTHERKYRAAPSSGTGGPSDQTLILPARSLGRLALDSALQTTRGKARKTSFRKWAGSDRVTLAIVFTDIVASTPLGIEMGDERMRELRAIHFAQARRMILDSDGFELKTIGDAFLVVFRSADLALDFALPIHASPGDPHVRVRVGVHMGELDVEGNDVFGTEVNFAARVVSASKAAEVWASDQVKHALDILKPRRHSALLWERHNDIPMSGFPEKATLWSIVVPKVKTDS